MKVRKGDQVQIIKGKDRGKSGKVLKVVTETDKVMVEGLNLVKKHVRPKRGGEKGQRVEVPAPVNISNVMIVCSKCGKPTRIGYKGEKDKKARICKKCEAEI